MWTSEEIERACRGTLKGQAFTAESVVIDTRAVTQGALFVALRGARVDGHDYLSDAQARGAAAALVSHVPANAPRGLPLVVVEDTQRALVDMGVAARARTGAKIIAVTGSVGKTGAKEAIRTALVAAGRVHATQGNYNNHLGLPLTLANLPLDAAFCVLEMGMNHAGEISFLTRVARPDIALITNVEAVHLEFFSHVDAIADAKAEIMEGLTPGGTLILNADNRYYERLKAKALEQSIQDIVTFGVQEGADCRLLEYGLSDLGSQVEALIFGTRITYRLGTIGRHYALTSLAALAACVRAGADLAVAAEALMHFYEPDGRGRVHRMTMKQGDIVLIDDCYNASPSAMAAAFAKLAEIKESMHEKGRAVAVLGDMLELGLAAPQLHKSLLSALTQHGIDKVFAAGPLMQHLYDALPADMQGGTAADATSLTPLVEKGLKAGDVVLIKGSRGSRMDNVRDALQASLARRTKERVDAV